MSKEIMLLERVLDDFSDIKKFLNTTNDIEHCLSKLKLNENVEGDIFGKTKNLVDTLYNYSLKVKDEFYRHFNKLEDVPVGKKGHEQSAESETEENTENDELIQDSSETDGSAIEENTESNDNIIQEDIGAAGTADENNRVESVSPTEEPVNVQHSKSNIEIMNGENSGSEVDGENYQSVVIDENCESQLGQLDDITSTKNKDAANTTLENELDNVGCTANDVSSECNADSNNASINKISVDGSLENEGNNLAECNNVEKGKETDSDNSVEKVNGHEVTNSSYDPLDVGGIEDTIDSTILDDNLKNKENTNNENKSVAEGKNSCEDTAEVKREPRIRLVDLSKLMDPKPPKSVKFDNSVIVLTSSDEESNTSKRKDTKDQNANDNVTLKSALKVSQKTYSDKEVRRKKKNEKETNKISRKYGSDSEESEANSSDSELKIIKVSTNRTKEKILARMKENQSEKNIQSLDSDVREIDDKLNKTKHSRRVTENCSDSEDSNCQPMKKKRKALKGKESSSDSSDCVIKDGSESEDRNESESLENKSRRSSRLKKAENQKQKLKECLKKKFASKIRASLSRSLRSNARLGKKSKVESDSESDTDSIKKTRSVHRRTNNKVIELLSDTSSLSDDEGEDVELKEKSKKNKKRKRKDMPADVDDKYTWKVYIPLPQIQCECLREIYLHNKEILEIKRLRKINLPKSSKRFHESKNNLKSSSDTEKPKTKKPKKIASPKSVSDNDESSDDDEPLRTFTKTSEKTIEKDAEQLKSVENNDDRMAGIVMDELKNLDDAEKKAEESEAEESSSDSEEEKRKSKNKNKNHKKAEEKSEDKKDEEEKMSDTESKKSEDQSSEETDENKEKKDKTSDAKNKKFKDNANEGIDSDEENEDKMSDAEDKTSEGEAVEVLEKDREKKDKTSDADNKKSEDEAKEETDEDKESEESDDEKKKKKKKWRSDKLLTAKIDSTDSDEEFSKFNKKKEKSREEIMRKTKKRVKKAGIISDSDDSDQSKHKNSEDSSNKNDSSNEKSSSSNESDKEDEETKKPARRRIKRTKGSSSSSEEDKSTRKQIRRVIGKDALSETTKQAEAEEKERKARIAEKQKKYNQIYEGITESKVKKVVLDYDEKKQKELLTVDRKIVKKLKPHQASGIQFMWDACFESLERAKTTKGSGCILAHCMGLGKTLQVIALVHTLLTNSEKTGVQRVLVVCPVNTVLNWKAEFKKWMPKDSEIEIYELVSCKQAYERRYCVEEWHNGGGVLIIGYTMFRNLSNPDNKRLSKKVRTVFGKGLVDPGPELVICDEGHLLKNEKTNLSIAMNRIKTFRRIVLTGTPLQNNLREYWCMVQFIKPNLLGTYKEYLNRFVNPITNGQYTDSTQHDILLMRKRSHVLHKLLDGVVQRRDYGVLEPYLPPKYEYVLFIALTETQIKLYKYYMDKFARHSDGSNRTSFLFNDFQQLQRICTHPRVLLDRSTEKREKDYDEEEDSEGSLKDFIDDGDGTSSSANSSSSNSGSESEKSDSDKKERHKSKSQQRVRVTRAQAAQRRENNDESDPELVEVTKEWWQEYCDGEELCNINNSGKLFLLFQILKECEEIGDKVLVFSQSLYTLNCIEFFLEKIDEATQNDTTDKVGGHSGSWSIGLDYFRLDGSSSCDNRATWCDNFNNPNNTRARLFLISTKAGGLGINLVAANRVIIFDVSWNPSHDIQSIYRVYRFGQTKPCYIYRFVTYGTMEMKIYERQVTKQAISKRVIDEQQIDRHYNQNDLQELYQCDLEPTDKPIPLVPKDVLLGELLQKYDKTVYKYHLHQSLLENKEDEGLNEEERKAAWEEFENEKVLRKSTSANFFSTVMNMNAQAIAAALANIVKKDNPGWSDVQIKGIIPALVQQLQVQLSEGDLTMYTRVQQEMQIMQALQAQKLKEAYYQQQVMRMIQQQQQQAKMLGNLNVDPRQLVRPQGTVLSSYFAAPPRFAGPSSAPQQPPLNDIIELND